jgi:hypothetical protein
MTKNINPNSVQLDSVVDPESYLTLALEGYSMPADDSSSEADNHSSDE